MPAPDILEFSRNRCTSVEQIDDQTLKSTCRLQDKLTEAMVELTVKLPDLEITAVTAEVGRTFQEVCRDPVENLQKVVGVRIGPGMLKIIKGLIGEESGCGQTIFMVEECCHGVILAFTKDTLAQTPRDELEKVEFYQAMVKANIRLYNRCAAFAKGSQMVAGIEPPD